MLTLQFSATMLLCQKDEPFSHELTLNLEKLLWFLGFLNTAGSWWTLLAMIWDWGIKFSCSTGTREVLFDCTCSFSSCLPELLLFTCSRTPKLRLLFPGHLDARVHGFKCFCSKPWLEENNYPQRRFGQLWRCISCVHMWRSHEMLNW